MINAREISYQVLLDVFIDGAYANLAISKRQASVNLESRDIALAQELAFGSIRNKLFYELVLERCAHRSVGEIDPKTQLLLLLGTHQLLATRIPVHASLNETVNLAKRYLKPGAVGFVNGVLRRVSERTSSEWLKLLLDDTHGFVEALSVRYSHPQWIVKALEKSLQIDGREEGLEELLAQDNVVAKVSVAALPGYCDPTELLADGLEPGKASPIGFELDSGNPADLQSVSEGRARVQDQGSQLVTLALTTATKVAKNETWLDLCAGPGGKASLLAALALQNGAELTCNELAPHRAKLVEQALKPINRNVYVRQGDGRDLGEDAPEYFDRILVDAPCTGLGSLRRRPEARWTKKQEDVAELVALQKQLLESAWKGLKAGGVVAYVTCSPHVSETIGLADWALKNLEKCQLIDAQQTLRNLNPNLSFNTERKTVQLWPHVHGTDAMFLALFQKPIG